MGLAYIILSGCIIALETVVRALNTLAALQK